MELAKAVVLLTGLAFIGANASLGEQDTITPTPTPTTASDSQPSSGCTFLPSTIKCNMEAKSKGLSQMYPIISVNAANIEECYAACTHEFYNERCRALAFTPSKSSCTLYDYAVEVNWYAQEGTGIFLWDRVCLECEGTRTTTSTAPTSTVCLPADSVCNVEGSWNNLDNLQELDYFGTYLGASEPMDCYEACLDRKSWGRCRSWSYTPSEERCLLYKVAVSIAFVSEAGTGNYFYDRKCWQCDEENGSS